MYNSIIRLSQMLTDNNIKHDCIHLYDGFQISNVEGCKDFDVIEHEGSYGHDDDLLEIMGLMTKEEEERESDSVLGFLTEFDVFDRIIKHRGK